MENLDIYVQQNNEPKNANFLQLSRAQMHNMRELITQNQHAAKILLLFGEKMNSQNAVLCSYTTLSEITGLSRTTLYGAIKVLEKQHWIQVVKVGTANAYVVNSRVLWAGKAEKKYAVFNASVIASGTEQGEKLEAWNKSPQLKSLPKMTGERIITDNGPLPPPDQLDLDLN